MIDNQALADDAFAMRILTSLSVDENLLPRYENLYVNFRGPFLRVEMAPRLKHTHTHTHTHTHACTCVYADIDKLDVTNITLTFSPSTRIKFS